MTEMTTRDWLLSDAPTTRRQARWGAIYQGWLVFRRNKLAMLGLIILILLVLSAIFAPLLSPYNPYAQNLAERLKPPSAVNWLGTDSLGRDILSRLIWGSRTTLFIVGTVALIAPILGLFIGTVAGFSDGWLDQVLMRVTDIFLAFPKLILALAFVAALGPGIMNVSVAIIVVAWTEYARVVRATTLVLREQVYVQAAQSIGASHARIIFREILPNALGPIIVLVSIGLGTAILSESALSFLGFGLPPPAPTWGWTLSYGTRFIRDEPWLSIISGATIMVTVLGFNLLGDGLRDVLDPRQLSRGGSKSK